MAQGDIWEVLNWDKLVRHSLQPTLTGEWAKKIVESSDPDVEFDLLAKAYLTGKPNTPTARRTRVTRMAATFDVDRKTLARYLRSKSIIGPRD